MRYEIYIGLNFVGFEYSRESAIEAAAVLCITNNNVMVYRKSKLQKTRIF